MDADSIQKLLLRLNCHSIRVGGNGWVHSSCPFAQWKHSGGIDEHPSFGIRIVEGGDSRYKCHSCNSSGSMLNFAWVLQSLSRRDQTEMFTFLQQANLPSVDTIRQKLARIGQYGARKPVDVGGIKIAPTTLREHVETIEQTLLEESELDRFEELSGKALDYMTGPRTEFMPDGARKRDFPIEVCNQWGVLWHPKADRIALPIRNVKQELVGISGRAIRKEQVPKYMHNQGFRRDLYLYGEEDIQKGLPCYIVEGFFDVWRLRMFSYPNVLGIFGSYISKFQLEKMVRWFSEVILIPDGDKAGREASVKNKAIVGSRMPVRVVKTPMGVDPDDFTLDLAEKTLGPRPNTVAA